MEKKAMTERAEIRGYSVAAAAGPGRDELFRSASVPGGDGDEGGQQPSAGRAAARPGATPL